MATETRTPVEINGREYLVDRLDAFKQVHVARRLLPGIAKMQGALRSMAPDVARAVAEATDQPLEEGVELENPKADLGVDTILESIAGALADMSDDDVDFVLKACLKVTQVKQKNGWANVTDRNGNLMFSDLNSSDLVKIAVEVIKYNMGDFFPSKSPTPPASVAPVGAST